MARGTAADHRRVRAIGCYTRLTERDFEGFDAVINCAGIVSGDAGTLAAVNVDLPRRLAMLARAAGVRRFVTIGSFSIFGARTQFDETAPPRPNDAYGASKLAAERALEGLLTADFTTLTVALPAILGTTRVGKVERMIRWWQRFGTWPVPRGDVTRSMIGADVAAGVLTAAAAGSNVGRVLAADPVPFRYRQVAAWLRQDVGGRFGLSNLPPSAVKALERVAPALHRSLMTDSWLPDEFNYTIAAGVATSLRPTLCAMLQQDRKH
ncbi:NAD-dependent epimerase/dehydratase family protein [Sphingomonas sp. BK235]|nr:NAD-dependent epimerase/dehydratase family protein [Sphingomonas sp. BK235]